MMVTPLKTTGSDTLLIVAQMAAIIYANKSPAQSIVNAVAHAVELYNEADKQLGTVQESA